MFGNFYPRPVGHSLFVFFCIGTVFDIDDYLIFKKNIFNDVTILKKVGSSFQTLWAEKEKKSVTRCLKFGNFWFLKIEGLL